MSNIPGANTAGANVSGDDLLTIPIGLKASGSPYAATITADNGVAYNAVMTVTVNVNYPMSSGKDIIAFTIPRQIGQTVITDTSPTTGTIAVTMPLGTDITRITSSITASTGARVNPASGVTQNFTNAVTYTVTAVDGSTKNYTVTVTVVPFFAYTITYYVFGSDGTLSATVDGMPLASGDVAVEGHDVFFTATPSPGYNVHSWTVDAAVISDNTTNSYTLSNVKASHSVYVSFRKTGWNAATELIEDNNFSILQNNANTLTDLRQPLADLINELILSTGVIISPNDITIIEYLFWPATEGNANNPAGTNGFFSFYVNPPCVSTSALGYGTIIATSNNDNVNGELKIENGELKAWTHGGVLYITGLTSGVPWYVYNLSGMLIYQNKENALYRVFSYRRDSVEEGSVSIPLPARGIYIVKSGNSAVKIRNQRLGK